MGCCLIQHRPSSLSYSYYYYYYYYYHYHYHPDFIPWYPFLFLSFSCFYLVLREKKKIKKKETCD